MNGLLPVSWQEISAWQQATGNHDQWLATIIRDLSKHYVNEFNLSKDPKRRSPISDNLDTEAQRKKVSLQFKKFREDNKK